MDTAALVLSIASVLPAALLAWRVVMDPRGARVLAALGATSTSRGPAWTQRATVLGVEIHVGNSGVVAVPATLLLGMILGATALELWQEPTSLAPFVVLLPTLGLIGAARSRGFLRIDVGVEAHLPSHLPKFVVTTPDDAAGAGPRLLTGDPSFDAQVRIGGDSLVRGLLDDTTRAALARLVARGGFVAADRHAELWLDDPDDDALLAGASDLLDAALALSIAPPPLDGLTALAERDPLAGVRAQTLDTALRRLPLAEADALAGRILARADLHTADGDALVAALRDAPRDVAPAILQRLGEVGALRQLAALDALRWSAPATRARIAARLRPDVAGRLTLGGEPDRHGALSPVSGVAGGLSLDPAVVPTPSASEPSG